MKKIVNTLGAAALLTAAISTCRTSEYLAIQRRGIYS